MFGRSATFVMGQAGEQRIRIRFCCELLEIKTLIRQVSSQAISMTGL